MFRISKVKLAAGIAAGALTLGGAGAYAAANSGSVALPPTAKTFTVAGLQLVSKDGTTLSSLPTFKDEGACVSFWAHQKNLALQSSVTNNRLPKNAHGKLVSSMASWCRTHNQSASASETSASETETADLSDKTDAIDSADKTDTANTKAAGHSRGHGHGHNGAATQTGD